MLHGCRTPDGISGRTVSVISALILAVAVTSGPLAAQPADGPRAKKILSIGGDITEILYALGAGHRIAAVDSTSQFPSQALLTKKNVGYMRALSTEGVISVGADLILASDRAGPNEVVKVLRAATRYVEIPEGTSAEGVPAKIVAVADAVGESAAGAQLAERVRSELAALSVERSGITKPLRALFVLSVQSGRATIGGTDTSAGAILGLAGLVNTANDVSGFKPVGDEAIHAMRPDVIVIMKRSSGSGHEAAEVLAMTGLAQSPAGRNKRLIEMDGLYLLGFGPRVASAARDLMRAAYSESSDLLGAER